MDKDQLDTKFSILENPVYKKYALRVRKIKF